MKIALVTGGSRGIGLETVRRLAAESYKVVTCSRSKSSWNEALDLYPDLANVDHKISDISIDSDIEQLFTYVSETYGELHAAVNNASPQIASSGRFHQVENSLLKDTLNIDFWAQALCLKHEIKLMKKGAAIVNISSVNGLRPTPGASMYSAAKHAMEGLTRSLALENIKDGIRINGVAPGVTWTPRWEEKQTNHPNIRQEVSNVVPIERFAHSEEVVNAIEFFLSEKASYIVGHTLVVDGGISLTGA
ncbi:SDR family NAD(P)-dependent oxidoreductase [Vibrio nitrifigilis]|uniref:SDR family oxidoreductase n=1 Tax=Vibrio nitrifigilis TaxID=2789781 RepID=A0ABS0GEP3_9VIBR|nr:SDR family oxidoreductase [Vibrio nitrifigilis]MBF9000887.1 SDR family oxidoreductase [Vibrio nitrifigilis]